MSDTNPKHTVGTDRASELINQGATFNPIYTVRRPVMWAIDETALKSMSALGAEANRHFSLASFLVGCIVSIIISCTSSTAALSPLGDIMLHKLTYILGLFALVLYGFGIRAQYQKNEILAQIKRECEPVKSQQ